MNFLAFFALFSIAILLVETQNLGPLNYTVTTVEGSCFMIRAANLINGNGKCLYAKGNAGNNGNNLVQWSCGLKEYGQLWSWNNDDIFKNGNRHICNGYQKCLASPQNYGGSIDLIQWDSVDEGAQKFTFFNMNTSTGFFMIRNDWYRCLGINGNSIADSAVVNVQNCDSSQSGQQWKWSHV